MGKKLDVKYFGPKLRQFRLMNRMTQAELSEAMGCTNTLICKLERSERGPSLEFAIQAARYFGVSLDALFLGDETTTLPPTQMYRGRLCRRENAASGKGSPKGGKEK